MESLVNPPQRTKAIRLVLRKPTKLTFGRFTFDLIFSLPYEMIVSHIAMLFLILSGHYKNQLID
jgi:hypothetical protein